MTGKLVRLLGQKYVDRPLQTVKGWRCPSKVTSAEKFNNQIYRTTHSAVLHLLSQPPPSLPNGFMNKVAMVAEMKVMHELYNMECHFLRLIWL